MRVLEVEGCRSSVVRALVAEASSPGFDSRGQPRLFFFFFLCFFPREFISIIIITTIIIIIIIIIIIDK